jgi:SAM-dependent methyltransferase
VSAAPTPPSRLEALRRRARRLAKPASIYLARAGLDARDAVRGTRDPLVPPRRLGLPGMGREIGRRVVDIALIDAAGLEPTSRVLDIGCGPGRNAAHLTRYLNGGSYEGFDVMPEAIRSAQRRITPRYPSFRFQLLDLMNATYNPGGAASATDVRFPYPDESFDVVFGVSVYTHLRPLETEHYLRETARVLKPGGRTASTFFLLGPESLELLERHPERQRLGRSGPVLLTHELTDERGWRFRVRDPEHPERELALYEADAVAIHERAGLPVSDIRGGHWCGREQRADNFGQDLIVATKPG